MFSQNQIRFQGDPRDYELASESEEAITEWMSMLTQSSYSMLTTAVADLKQRLAAAEAEAAAEEEEEMGDEPTQ